MITSASADIDDYETGMMSKVPIKAKLFADTEDYFSGKIPKSVYQMFKRDRIPSTWRNANDISPEECVEYKQSEHTLNIYVPADYTPDQAFGLYVHIRPNDQLEHRASSEYRELFDELGIIYVSPDGTSNSQSSWRRIVLAVDSMAHAFKFYNIDRERVYIGGFSGGGHMAMMTQMIYPEYFQGAISHAAQSYLPTRGIGHFPGVSMSDINSSPRKQKKWCVISGSKDQNYAEIIKTSKEWEKTKLDYKFINSPLMAHTPAPAEALREALAWMGENPEIKKQKAAIAKARSMRTWTSTAGSSLTARFVKHDRGMITLVTADNKNIKLDFMQLSGECREFINIHCIDALKGIELD
ncbi:prolyl oligopeptidase family serine peptidase [Persicirhabdus sediminis]|uniref:Peptidase S9 prolyl oligopeptidase catalytic domain-containing protein n=1 Tax=Persicirhabdus sediminis TaxID=454144 RepID=A0A8J7MEH9_9BACT|nr:prolyl oligopeptidase family serine peptidase [Persicirhabdus sediminis]MBK1791228.1 hypothetical protein [Persicirhabdus sediminis]